MITRSEICQAFWPELDTDQAVNVFHVTKRRLHKALDMDVLVHLDGYYRINPELDIDYDVMHFATQLMEGRDKTTPTESPRGRKAIDLYRGPFLQGHSDRWILDRRADFQAGFLEALTEMAQYRLTEDRPEFALGLYQRAVGENITPRGHPPRNHASVYQPGTPQRSRRPLSEAASGTQQTTSSRKRAPSTKKSWRKRTPPIKKTNACVIAGIFFSQIEPSGSILCAAARHRALADVLQ